jgi:NAD(P)-dependent dehydrogenase (short-subunit alcohol dehydrogenase family)
MGRLSGQIALVTGASRGLGAAIAETFAAQGAHVAAVARRLNPDSRGSGGSLTETLGRIHAAGGAGTPFTADLSNTDECDRLVAEVVERVGPPTILVNSAAVTFLRPLRDFPLRRAQVMLNLHLLTPLRLAQLVVPGMRERGTGWILSLTSVAANPAQGPPYGDFDVAAGFGVYGSVKAALDRMTTSLAAELHADNIAANAAAPLLPVRTPGAAALNLAQSGTEDISLICRTALELCSGDPARLTGRIAHTTPFLAALDRGEVDGAYSTGDVDGAHSTNKVDGAHSTNEVAR